MVAINRRRFSAGCAALLLAMTAGTAAGQAQVMRYSQWLTAAHFSQAQGFHKFFEDVAKATDGRVKIEPTAQGLGAPPRQMQLAVDGIADVAWALHGYTPGSYPLSELAELPFLSRKAESNSVAYWRVFKAMFEKAGMHSEAVYTLTMHVHPPGHVFNNKQAIRSLADFKGLKIRSTNTIVTDALQAFGATPLPMPVTQLRDALSKGITDGTTFPAEAILNFRIEEFIRHGLLIPGGLYNSSFTLVMNRKKWDSIAKNDQAAINALAGEALARRIGRLWDVEEDNAVDKLKARGVEFVSANPEMMAKLKETLAPFEKKWFDDARAKGVDGPAALRMFRDETARN